MNRAIISLLAVVAIHTDVLAEDRPTDAARRVAEEIRHEALLPPNGPDGRPLPLASQWNVGTVAGTFEPDHQIGLIQQGHHVLPWMSWPKGNPADDRFDTYYGRLLRYFSRLDLPISIRGTQWNAMLVKKPYRNGPLSEWAGVVTPGGERVPRLSPFGAVEPWKDPAKTFVDTAAMKRAQEIYPDPPLILWVSNNEPPDLRWKKHGPLETQSGRYLEQYGRGRSDEFKRKVVAEGWMKRYPVMFDAMRQSLVNETWRRNVRFVGYGAFGPSHFGRGWGRWKVYSLITDVWTAPHWHFWDGGSPSYYTHNWSDIRDHWVFSTQVEAMNWVFMLEEAWRANPDFWFEMSTWDGNGVDCWIKTLGVSSPQELAKASSHPLSRRKRQRLDPEAIRKCKVVQYIAVGQDYPTARTAGWIQFGMWLLRPRVVREFRSHATPLKPVEPYWMETVRAVDRVHADATLRSFWRYGKLVPNRARRHPYQSGVPEKYEDIHRWYLLDTNLDPENPWRQKTDLPVFSLALVQGESGSRRWLLYAHSPLEDREAVEIRMPEFGTISVDVPRSGAFYVVNESTGDVQLVGAR